MEVYSISTNMYKSCYVVYKIDDIENNEKLFTIFAVFLNKEDAEKYVNDGKQYGYNLKIAETDLFRK